MKKQFTKIKIAAENLSRSSKTDPKDFELETIEKQVDKYRDVVEKMVRKIPTVSSTTDIQERDKRIKKNSHYKIGQALEESSKELSKEMPLHHVLLTCGELEKSIAECMVDSELETETEVVRRLKLILDNEIQEASNLKRNVSRTLQEYTSLKRSYEAAIRLDEPMSKINHIKEQQEQCEQKLEKERDAWAAQMFELIAKEDVIVQCIRDYVLNQRNYHERALQRVNQSLAAIQDTIQSTVKSRFGTSLAEQLASTNREISYIIELCVCCLIEDGLYEKGLLRVGCASTKLRRLKHALEAQYVKTPLPLEYQDPHVIGSILKLYLRELPEPLLTFKCYQDFIQAAESGSEAERKAKIKAVLAKLPKENYVNLRYLTRFLWLVTQSVEQNKMNSQNLAIVMSPNMLWPRMEKSGAVDYLVNSSSTVNIIVELLISQWDYFFEGEVDFFVTLQRDKLFEGKGKSSSSNEHLDRHEGDISDSPRYGTLRRNKPCAPSPPAKTYEKAQNSNGTTNSSAAQHLQIKHPTDLMQISKNGEINDSQQQQQQQQPQNHHNNHQQQRPKELFPASTAAPAAAAGGEKPEKPPVPKLPQIQLQQQHQQQSQQQAQLQQQQQQETPKPVPMTRTQFFGLDNLPSPVADRKSSDSGTLSGAAKPDLPLKPKIPKRPMVLGLNAGSGAANKSDEEGGTGTPPDSGGSVSGGEVNEPRKSTEKFIDKLRHENCDNSITKEHNHNNHNQHLLDAEQNVANANQITTNAKTTATTNANATLPVPSTTDGKQQQQQQTPTTPISPSMAQTPKRPTVPAPPPPSVIKK